MGDTAIYARDRAILKVMLYTGPRIGTVLQARGSTSRTSGTTGSGPKTYLSDPQPKHAFVYVCTIQHARQSLRVEGPLRGFAVNLDDEADAEEFDIRIDAFDVVIGDEHLRGYTAAEGSKWRQVLEHFDATKVGLTATPAAHTTAYFADIVHRYEYERVVREGYLVYNDPVAVHSAVRLNGLFLKEDAQ